MSTIFEFNDSRSWLNHLRAHYPGRRRPITLKAWAKILGFRSDRGIAMVLNGQRLPSAEMLDAIPRTLNLSDRERRYFELLVMLEKKKRKGQDAAALERELQALRTKGPKHVFIQSQTFTYISKWHHLAIKQLVSAPGFRDDPKWIAKRLRDKITPAQAREALDTMLSLGIIRRVGGAIRLSEEAPLYTPEDIPSTAVRQHHREMMDRAKEALEEQDIVRREFISVTVKVDPARVPEIKKALRELRDRFNTELVSAESSRVYQLNLQFFEHTAGDPLEA